MRTLFAVLALVCVGVGQLGTVAVVKAAEVRSRSGIRVSVAPSAQRALQCVIDHVERAGVRIAAMRGHGAGTVRGSLHPSGQALDINQTARDRTSPAVPRYVANAAADACGVVSGARWRHADNGHWNIGKAAAGRPERAKRRYAAAIAAPAAFDRHGTR